MQTLFDRLSNALACHSFPSEFNFVFATFVEL